MTPDKENGNLVKLVECPRDAMQGWPVIIPTDQKIKYLNSLLEVGFDSLDFGSFVSAKAIPQMADTREVIEGIIPQDHTRLLAIVANKRGAQEASAYDVIADLGFPFSISETFQQRNTNSSIQKSTETVSEMLDICARSGKRLVIYISMAFGNPYGDQWSPDTAVAYIRTLVNMGVKVISLADTVGLADAEQIYSLTRFLISEFPLVEAGVHLHSRPGNSVGKIEAAFNAGCRRFDGALMGIGGCPMAGDELVGNMDSVMMIDYFQKKKLLNNLDETALVRSKRFAGELFINH